MKKITFISVFLLIFLLSGCAQERDQIDVISREDGSGTRGAFMELLGIVYEEGDKSIDQTKEESEVTNSTAVVMQTVGEDKNAIGYMSMGSLNNSVRALKVNGVEATTENVKNGRYGIARSFLIVTTEGIRGEVEDFINFILSKNGQKIITENGYVASETNPKEYKSSGKSGTVKVAGSSSVTPVMESLAQEYIKINPEVHVEIEQSDSTTGITAASEKIADIGMSSRELDRDELALGLKPTTIAYDGLAVIVNKENTIDNLRKDQIADIFTGKITNWEELNGKS